MHRRYGVLVLAALTALALWQLRSADKINLSFPRRPPLSADLGYLFPGPLPRVPSASAAPPTTPSASATPAIDSNQLLANSYAAIRDLATVHITGEKKLASNLSVSLNISATKAGDSTGSILVGLHQYDVIQLKNDCYIKGLNIALFSYHKTCTIPSSAVGSIDVRKIVNFADILHLLSPEQIGSVSTDKSTGLRGSDSIQLKGKKATVSVAETGTPLPTGYQGPMADGLEASLQFTDWGKTVKVTRPA